MTTIWQGRNDGNSPEHLRLFQCVQLSENYQDIQSNDFVLHGFAVDEGVRRNKGRVGAKDAPDVIRKNMGNFPVFNEQLRILDFGNVVCVDNDLEKAQSNLAEKVSKTLSGGGKSIVLGGGHEVTFAHYSGIKQAFPNQKIGIINFDAHFDNREPEIGIGASSGTGFWQIAQEGDIHSLHIGIQKNSNTQKLFNTAHDYGMKYILADDLHYQNIPTLLQILTDFLDRTDKLYISICMDVFNASIAPGVSATAYNGVFADVVFMKIFRFLLQSDKMTALDIAEVNPNFDLEARTARLAGSLANEWLMVRG